MDVTTTGNLTEALQTAIARGFVGDREALEEAALNGHLRLVECFHRHGVMLKNYNSLRRIFLLNSSRGREDILEHLFTIYDIDDTLISIAMTEAIKIPSTFFYLYRKRERKLNQGELNIFLYRALIAGTSPVVVKFLIKMGAIPGMEAIEVMVRNDISTFILIYEIMPKSIIYTTRESWGKRIREFLQDIVDREDSYNILPLPVTSLNTLIARYL